MAKTNQMKLITTTLLCMLGCLAIGQPALTLEKPRVDERVELLSIAFRLAGSEEFSAEIFRRYTDRIVAHYRSHRDHELIRLIRQLRSENGVGYDAVMAMAVHLDRDFRPRVPFTDQIPDERWGRDQATRFVRLLQQFYQDTDSRSFFRKNRDLYREATQRFAPVCEQLDLDWYRTFYGKEPNERFVIVPGPGNGGGNYGPAVTLADGSREVYAIMGTWKTDSLGMPIFPPADYFPTLLHEFNHSFVNYLIDDHPELFRESGEALYAVVRDRMNAGGYHHWQTMMKEALVRAAVIKYMVDHNYPPEQIALEREEQLNRGFLWINELVVELMRYDHDRSTWPTLESFVPELATAFADYATRIDAMAAARENEKPRLISIGEFSNGDRNVDPALKQLTLHFSKPFRGSNFIRPGNDDSKSFPPFTGMRYSEDSRSVILEWELESGVEYRFYLIGLAPASASAGDYKISFRTR